MKRKHMAALVALGVAALAGVVLLWRASQSGAPDAPGSATVESDRGEPGTPGDNAGASGAAGPAARSGSPAPRPQVPVPVPGAPAPADLAATGQVAPGSAAREDGGARAAAPRVYVRDDGVLVRDHRTRDAPPMSSGMIRRPQHTVTKVDPTTVIAVRNTMRPIVYQCSAEVPETSMGEKARLQGEVVISIADKSLSVDKVVIRVADVQEPAASRLRECVLQDMKLVTLAVPGGADVTGHPLTLPFRLRQ